MSVALVQVERRKGFITSGIQFLFWLLLFVTGIVPFYSKILDATDLVRLNVSKCATLYFLVQHSAIQISREGTSVDAIFSVC